MVNDSFRPPGVSLIMQILNRKLMVFPADTQLSGIPGTAKQTGVPARAEYVHGILTGTKSCSFNYYRINNTGEIIWIL